HPRDLRPQSARTHRSPRHQVRHADPRPATEDRQAHRSPAPGADQEAARRYDLRTGPRQGAGRMRLSYDLIQKLQNEPPADAWRSIFAHAWSICAQPIDDGKAEGEVVRRDRALADIDLYLATAGWDLWTEYE